MLHDAIEYALEDPKGDIEMPLVDKLLMKESFESLATRLAGHNTLLTNAAYTDMVTESVQASADLMNGKMTASKDAQNNLADGLQLLFDEALKLSNGVDRER